MQEAFGEFKVLERVGSGLKAETFRARDTRAGRTAAIKVLTSDLAMDPVVGVPFVDEAYLAEKLGHPNVAALYEIGEQDGRPHLVYEFIQGQSLTAVLAGQPINPRRALELATQIADALADAHALGLVHRALRPDKVIVSLKGNAKVLDFGLGHYATAVIRQVAEGGGPEAGTAVRVRSYWAPEQWSALADARSDTYSLGLVLLEMLTGRPPSGAGAPPDTSGVPGLIQPILARMLAVDPASRIESAATVAAELRQLVVTLEAQRDAPREPVQPPVALRPPAPPPMPAPAPAPAPPVPLEQSPATALVPADVPPADVPPTVAPNGAAGAATVAGPVATPPARKPKSGVTVTSPAPKPSAPAVGSGLSGTSAKGAARKGPSAPGTARSSAPRRPAVGSPRPAAVTPPVAMSGAGKAALFIAVAVVLLLILLYLIFG